MQEVIVTSLYLGFFLGMAHALDPDHLVAVGTLAVESESVQRSSLLGVFWGMGHTATLALVGGAVVMLKLTIPDHLAVGFEGIVGVMIVLLGAGVFWHAMKGWKVHAHVHSHGGIVHSHVHAHCQGKDSHYHHFRWSSQRAFVTGMVHGVAGSAALSMMVMTSLPTTIMAMCYILLFGLGSIGGMLLMSVAMSLPFLWVSSRLRSWYCPIKAVTGVLAMVFGAYITYGLFVSYDF